MTEIINLLGDKLSKEIGITPLAARGLLKLSIKDELGPFKPISQLDYDILSSVIQNSLRARLIKIGLKETDSTIKNMIEELNKNQSLITLEKV